MRLLAHLPPSIHRPVMLGVGGAALLSIVWWATLPRAGDEPSPPAPPPVSLPEPSLPPPSSPPAAPVMPAASLDALKLHGVLGAAAIIARADGVQILVRTGRTVLPGVILAGVERDAAILEQGGGRYRLSLVDGAGASRVSAIDATDSGQAAGDTYRAQDAAAESVDFRQAFAPHREGGQITGFTIRPGSDVALFRKAGLQPGDIVTEVNGRAFASEAEVNGLAREIALSAMLRVAYLRDGKRQHVRIAIDK